MSPEIKPTVPSLRSKFHYLFLSITNYYRVVFHEEVSDGFEEAKAASIKLTEEGCFSEYQVANINELFQIYPTLPVKSKKAYSAEEERRFVKINDLLDLIINDLSETIGDMIKQDLQHSINQLLNDPKGM